MGSGVRLSGRSVQPGARGSKEIEAGPEVSQGLNDRHLDAPVNPLTETEFMSILRSTELRLGDYGPWFSGHEALQPRFEFVDIFKRTLDGKSGIVKRMIHTSRP